MDTDGFPLATISEKSVIDDLNPSVRSKKASKSVTLRPVDSNGGIENGDISISKYNPPLDIERSIDSVRSNDTNPPNIDQRKQFNHYEITSRPEDSYELELENKNSSPRQSQLTNDNDVIEIHQFSLADIDAYLDIYFETLNNRLRHYIGGDEEIQQFRQATKARISKKTNF
jgi:hypothetical protein